MFLHTCMLPACCFRQRTYVAQGLVNRVLKESWTHWCLQFEWFSFGYGFILRSSSLFLRVCFTFACFTPHWYLICFLPLTVCVGVVFDFTNSYFSSVSVRVCVLEIFCLCMYGSVVWNLLVTIFSKNFFVCIHIYISMYVCVNIYIYIYIYVCVCVCVCVPSLMLSSEKISVIRFC